ncbi:methyltransferase, FxLD system [Streptomyces sp. DASNCL29]|uniref:methyltransferase, FxLD system n=1 Tax=Streptomyces sp. DASNCL29 TaxID=2583819 RepID=UPI0014862333|nr:methyltransferase, FxLD system [Streptomyces sp. DASNCL29]
MNSTPTVDDLRNALVDQIVAKRPLPPRVERALRTVHREVHLPGLDPAVAYSNRAITIKENPEGPLALSCASVPSTVAMMLGQLDAQPGDRILEIGAGTGYNAALLSEIVGEDGEVTTIDIDADVTQHARDALHKAGYEHVRVMERDGLKGAPEYGPYTRMIGTVGFWDIPAALRDQLIDGGRFVLPLRWRGQTRSVVLNRQGEALLCDDMELCGFVPIVGQDGERTVELADGTVRLHHDQDQDVDPARLNDALTQSAAETWSEVRVGGEESFDGIWLRATAFEDTVCRLEATRTAVENGLRRPVIIGRSPALVAGGSLAYLISKRDDTDTERPSLLGAAHLGPDGVDLAKRLVAHITAWGADRTATPNLAIYPAGTPDNELLAGHVIDKADSRVVLSFA